MISMTMHNSKSWNSYFDVTAFLLTDGCEPFSEDLLTEIRIDKLTFQGVKLYPSAIFARLMTFLFSKDNQLMRLPNSYVNLVWRDSLTGGVKGNVVKVGDLVYVLKMVSSADEFCN
ncbi:hypothetical protein RchiOBHm_Chr3g0492021 [Rosa chinensis]|uniref:Uncharacterized protein n=1 Tax=Rosa chinensis TaxID=74649 RepID=A0A2P6RGD8_ROSCH|nr:hypothetical protein RchiOBHm_Chr3g0492021 [Rosa chinensis]